MNFFFKTSRENALKGSETTSTETGSPRRSTRKLLHTAFYSQHVMRKDQFNF